MKNRQRVFFILILVVGLAVSASLICGLLDLSVKKNHQKEPGVLLLPAQQDESLDFALNGEWDFFPGRLIVSESDSEEQSSETGSEGQSSETGSEGQSSEADSEGLSPETVPVPGNLAYYPEYQNRLQDKASYRITITGIKANNSGMLLILPETYSNYTVYVNGQQQEYRISSPWGYPVFDLQNQGADAGAHSEGNGAELLIRPESEITSGTRDIEIVIEMTGHFMTGLTSAPHITSVSYSMEYFDNMRHVVLIFISICMTVFILLLIYMVVIKNRRLLPHYLFGILYMVIFILNTLWTLGFQDILIRYIPLQIIDWLVYILNWLGVFLIFRIRSIAYPEVFTRKQTALVGALTAGAVILKLVFTWQNVWGYCWEIAAVIFAVCLVLWIRNVWRIIPRETSMFFIMESGVFFLFMAALVNFMYLFLKISVWMLLVFPVCTGIYLVVVFLVFLIYSRLQSRRLEQQLQMEVQMRKTEAALIAGRMQPHFLYNSLTAIQELCYTAPEKAASLIVRFSNYLRSSINFMEFQDLIPFDVEMDIINNYICIQKERFEDELEFEADIMYRDFRIPPFGVQPLIENAIHYGVRAGYGKGKITLRVEKDDTGIVIRVCNYGEELKEENLKEYHSICNIRERLKLLLNGTLSFFYDEETHLLTVEIRIPDPAPADIAGGKGAEN